MEREDLTFDYLVVGGGTAGVVIASRLSQYYPSSSVGLLEAGPNAVDHPNVTNPIAFWDLIADGLTIDYSTAPQEHLNGRQVLNLAGRMLSGSSAGNVGVWMRASSTDYDIMARRAGNERFKYANLLPYFRRVETHWDKNANPQYHGFDGPVHTVGGRKYPLRDKVLQSAKALGHKYNADATKGDPTGLVDLTQCFRATSEASSERQHSARVYDLSRVNVRCSSPVAKIIFGGSKRATGVELLSGEKLHATKEVIVCCGAQKTPQILMLSGVGPSDELSKHQIPQVVDAPGVGKNLFDHSSLTQYFKIKNPEEGLCLPFNGTMQPEYGQGFPWDFFLFSNMSPSKLSPLLAKDGLSESQNEAHPHLREKRCHTMNIPFYFPALATPQYNPDIGPMDGKHMAFSSILLLPISKGNITLKTKDPNDGPVIDPRFLSTETDRYILREAVRQTLDWTATEPFASHLDGETPPADPAFPPLNHQSTDEEIDARLRGYMQTVAHPMGTCALGSVLDGDFRVKGVNGLRVCDASVFPEPIGAMPCQTVYALAELCADVIAEKA